MYYYEDEKLKKVDADEVYFNEFEDEEEQEEVEAEPVKEVKAEKKVAKAQKRETIEDPEEKKTFEPTLENLTLLLSFASILMILLAKMFWAVSVGVMCTIFYWIGAVALGAGIVIYVMQIIKAKKVIFEPQLIVLLLAILCC